MSSNTIARPTPTPSLDPSRWVEDHGDYLFSYAISRLRDPAVAEDLVQDTFLAALRAHTRFSGRSTERTWLTGILKHKLADYFRKADRERPYDVPALHAKLTEAEGLSFDRRGHWRIPPSTSDHHPSKAMELAERAEQIAGCVGQLKGRLQDVFTLREIQGRSADEICRELGISESNLWVTLYRARARLRTCLAESTGTPARLYGCGK